MALIQQAQQEARQQAAEIHAEAKAKLLIEAGEVKEELTQHTGELALQMVEQLLKPEVLPREVQQRLLDEELGKL